MPARNAKIQIITTGGLDIEQAGGILVPLEPAVEVPYLTQANNVVFENGSLRKVGGAILADLVVRGNIKAILPASGAYDTSNNGDPVDFWVVYQDDGIIGYRLDPTNPDFSTVDGFTSQIAQNVVQFNSSSINSMSDTYTPWTITEFEGYTIIASEDTTIPVQMLKLGVGNPTITPHFSMSVVYQNRLWVAGDASNPSRLYYSDLNDPTAGYSGNFFDINPEDGSKITALHVYRGNLFIFKGPIKGSITVLTGATPSTFALSPFSETIGCVGPNAITDFQDDVMFMDTAGHSRTLATTDRFGDFQTAVVTDPIRDIITGALDKTQLKFAEMHNDALNSRIWLSIPTGTTQDLRQIIIIDYKNTIKITTADWVNSSHIIPVRANETTGKTYLMGNSATFLYALDEVSKERIENFTKTGTFPPVLGTSEAYTAYIELPTLKFAPAFGFNNLSNVCISTQSVEKSPLEDDTGDPIPFDPSINLTFKWQRDLNEFESVVLNQTFGSRLGLSQVDPETGPFSIPNDGSEFVLNASRLGGPKTVETYAELETSDFRRVAFAFEQGGLNEGLHVHSFAITVGADDSGSTENIL